MLGPAEATEGTAHGGSSYTILWQFPPWCIPT